MGVAAVVEGTELSLKKISMHLLGCGVVLTETELVMEKDIIDGDEFTYFIKDKVFKDFRHYTQNLDRFTEKRWCSGE